MALTHIIIIINTSYKRNFPNLHFQDKQNFMRIKIIYLPPLQNNRQHTINDWSAHSGQQKNKE